MVQGDAYNIELTIRNQGALLDIDAVETVEVQLLNINRVYPGEVQYSDGKFLFPVTQEETFKLPTSCPIQVRVKLKGDDVIGSCMQYIDVCSVLSRVVL